MNKRFFLFLPIIGMMDGEENPNPYKKFITSLGIEGEMLQRLEKGEDIVEDFTQNYSNTLKSRHEDEWVKNHRENLEKEIRTGNYKAIQNKLAKKFELDLKEFEGKDKPTELMLEAAVEKYKKQILSMEEKFKNSSDSTKTQLSQQLDQANALLKDREAKLNELNGKIENLPQLIEQGREELRKEMFVEGEINTVINDLREIVIDAIPTNVLKTIILTTAKFSAKKGDDGYTVDILNPTTSTPFPKSKTENYKDLADFIKHRILIPNKWIKQQNPKPEGEGARSGEGKGDDTSKKSYVHPNAAKAAGFTE